MQTGRVLVKGTGGEGLSNFLKQSDKLFFYINTDIICSYMEGTDWFYHSQSVAFAIARVHRRSHRPLPESKVESSLPAIAWLSWLSLDMVLTELTQLD